jgi:hypothetical protein
MVKELHDAERAVVDAERFEHDEAIRWILGVVAGRARPGRNGQGLAALGHTIDQLPVQVAQVRLTASGDFAAVGLELELGAALFIAYPDRRSSRCRCAQHSLQQLGMEVTRWHVLFGKLRQLVD